MERKFNDKAGESYSYLVATEIADDHFRRHDFISGKEILELTPLRQINLFVVKNLFTQWQTESEKIRSPYFDYQSEEVKKATDSLLNALSRNIRISRNHFEPLLRTAVAETLRLILAPVSFYRHELEHQQGSWSAEKLKARFKYVRVNRFIADGLIDRVGNHGTLSVSQAIEMLNEIKERYAAEAEPVEDYLEQFNRIASIREDQLIEQNEKDVPAHHEFSAENSHSGPGDDAMEKIANEQKSIYQQYEREVSTIHDKLKTGDEEVQRAPIHQGSHVENLRQSLTINQQFMFRNSLFGGNEQAFDQALSMLDGFSSLREARQYLSSEVTGRFNWEEDSEEAEEFYTMLNRRYGK